MNYLECFCLGVIDIQSIFYEVLSITISKLSDKTKKSTRKACERNDIFRIFESEVKWMKTSIGYGIRGREHVFLQLVAKRRDGSVCMLLT